MASDPVSIDDFEPLPVRRPGAIPDLCELVTEAVGSGRGIYPIGGRTTLDVGLPPIKPGTAVDTTGLAQVIDYPARDMTITVEAGITLAKLQETLAAEGQWLPVDVPQPERATLGGAIALNLSGPRRYGYGTLRDYVIGIRFVTDEGREVKAGGQVVKNVAGYDLMKLHTGAVGTLGVVTRVTLKVRPKPEASVLVSFGCGRDDLAGVLDLLHSSKSRPIAVELLNAGAWKAAGQGDASSDWVLVAGFEEKAVTVGWQVDSLRDELKTAPVRNVVEHRDADAELLWAALIALQARPESRYIWKANVLPSRVADLANAQTALVPFLLHAEALNGIVWFHAPDGFPLNGEAAKLPNLEQRVHECGGNVVTRRCPPATKKTLRVWGRPTGDRELMRHVKRTLDPNNVFNPGRLFGDV